MSFKRCERYNHNTTAGETTLCVQSFTDSTLLLSDRSHLFGDSKGNKKQKVGRFDPLPVYLDGCISLHCECFSACQSGDENSWSCFGLAAHITVDDSSDIFYKLWDRCCLMDFCAEVLGAINETSRAQIRREARYKLN